MNLFKIYKNSENNLVLIECAAEQTCNKCWFYIKNTNLTIIINIQYKNLNYF